MNLMHLPPSSFLTPSSVPESFCCISTRNSLSIHSLLAAYVAFDEAFTSKSGKYAAWKATWPSLEDFRASLPLLWSEKCRGESGPLREKALESDRSRHHLKSYEEDATFSLLPASMLKMLDAQTIKYRQDFHMAMSMISSAQNAHRQSPRHAEDSFKYAWCIVNTRCLYYDHPFAPNSTAQLRNGSLANESSPIPQAQSHNSNHHIVLCPLIDLFNHTSDSSSACNVTYNSSGFTVTYQQARPAARGEEIFVSYGPHSNDFLFVEYGFVLPGEENSHDSISLDAVILPMLNTGQRRKLDAKGYLGEYTLFSPAANRGEAGVCWRTEVVARMTILAAEQWEGLVDGLLSEDELAPAVEEKAKALIRAWVGTMHKQAEGSLRALQRIGDDQLELTRLFGDDILHRETQIPRRRYALVLERWSQIVRICQSYLLPRPNVR
jgi:SET domain